MKRFVLLDTTPIPENGGALCLFEYGEDFVIKIQGGDGGQLMNTRMHGSEDALAEIPCRKVAGRPGSRVLIGGLGLGFTLQRVLADARVERAVVVEIEEPLIEWMRDGTVPHGPGILADARASVVNADIAMAIAEARSTYDLVLLDVDNGPGYLVHEGNEAVYGAAFLGSCRDLLRPGGVLVVWSAAAAPDLLTALRSVFGDAEEQAHDVLLQDRPEQYFLYLARR